MKTVLLAMTIVAAPAFAQDAPPPSRGGGAIMRADTNGDGVVTRAEALAQAGERFDRMDLNGDGKLTPDEMPRRTGRGPDTPPPPLPPERAVPRP